MARFHRAANSAMRVRYTSRSSSEEKMAIERTPRWTTWWGSFGATTRARRAMAPLYHFRTSRPRVMKYPVPCHALLSPGMLHSIQHEEQWVAAPEVEGRENEDDEGTSKDSVEVVAIVLGSHKLQKQTAEGKHEHADDARHDVAVSGVRLHQAQC